jgi:hypothetical protein
MAAAGVDGLYQARVHVTGQEEPARSKGFALGLADVLVKLTGDPKLLGDPAIAALGQNAGSYVTSFHYRDLMAGIPVHDEQGTRQRPFIITIDFDPAKTFSATIELPAEAAPAPVPQCEARPVQVTEAAANVAAASSQTTSPQMTPRPPIVLRRSDLDAGASMAYNALQEQIVAQRSAASSSILLFAGDPGGSLDALELASRLAEHSQGKILLVADAAQVRSGFELPPAYTLAGVLQGRSTWESATQATSISGLHLLSPGAMTARYTESAPAAVWDEARRRYQYLLIGPGGLSRQVLAALCPISDGAYLLLSVARSPRKQAVQLAATLKTAGAQVLGCIALQDAA